MTKKYYAIEFAIDTNPENNPHTLSDIQDCIYQQILEHGDKPEQEIRLKDKQGKSIGTITTYTGG